MSSALMMAARLTKSQLIISGIQVNIRFLKGKREERTIIHPVHNLAKLPKIAGRKKSQYLLS